MPKYRVTGWIQATSVIDTTITADSASEAKNEIYYSYGDVNNCELEVETILE